MDILNNRVHLLYKTYILFYQIFLLVFGSVTINLNNNKLNLERLIKKYVDRLDKLLLLKESSNLIEKLEENNYTVSNIYYLVLIAKDLNILKRQLDEMEDIHANLQPKIPVETISKRLGKKTIESNLII